VDDNWTKDGSISDAWDRWSIFPWFMYPRYDLDWSTRLVAKIAQEVPAWREACTEIIDLLLQRMTQYAAWFDCVEQKGLDPHRAEYPYDYYDKNIPPGWAGVYNAPGYYGNGLATKVAPREVKPRSPYTQPHSPGVGRTYNPDPIYANGGSYMMYKGYLLNMIGLYEFVSGDDKYDKPIELVYDDKIRFQYTHEQIAQVHYDQFMGSADEGGSDLTPGIDCEVGKVFPWCVSVSALGLRMCDKLHNTNYQASYYRWLDWAKLNLVGGATEPNGPYRWATVYYDRDIPYNMNGPKQQIPGNFFCCAYQYWPDDQTLARRLYEGAKLNFMRTEPDGSAHINFPPELGGGEDLVGFGAAVACAKEFGDFETHGQLLRWADAHYQPTSSEGEFYYKFGLDEPWPRGWPNDWILLAFAGGPGSWYRLFTDPNVKKFYQPTVSGVDYPTVAVRQAYYDESLGALMIAISPGDVTGQKAGAPTTFRVTNLQPTKEHVVLQDGQPFTGWELVTDTEITVKTTVDGHTFVIR